MLSLIFLQIHLILICLCPIYKIARRFFQASDELYFHHFFAILMIVCLLLPLVKFSFYHQEVVLSLVDKREEVMQKFLSPHSLVKTKNKTLLTVDQKNLEEKDNLFQNEKIIKFGQETFWFLSLLGFMMGLFMLIRQLKIWNKFFRNAYDYKKWKNLRIVLSSETLQPYALFWGGKSVVVIPQIFLEEERKSLWQVSLKHELTHIRLGHHVWCWFFEFVRLIFFINPAIHFLIKVLHHYQELCCDRDVLLRNQKTLTEKMYAHILVSIAISNQKAKEDRQSPFALAMASYERQPIIRRIDMFLLSKKSQSLKSEKSLNLRRWSKSFAMCLSLFSFIWHLSFANSVLFRYRPLTIEEAKEMFLENKKIKKRVSETFPHEINDKVLKWLNYFLTDEKGRVYTLAALERMKSYEQFLREKLHQKSMPEELLAIPFLESGFMNELTSSAGAKGLWSFMPGTARLYGLKVDKEVDERLNVAKLTDAAIRHYQDLYADESLQKDWRLVLLAYNAGVKSLKEAMNRQGTSNPWELRGVGDTDYLAKAFASILVVSWPKDELLSTPLRNFLVSSSFGYRYKNENKREFHRGVDLVGKEGDEVFSLLPGVVIKRGNDSIVLSHGEGLETHFSHLKDLKVEEGMQVLQGEKIGVIGPRSKESTGAHLHLEMLINGRHVDPESFFTGNKL